MTEREAYVVLSSISEMILSRWKMRDELFRLRYDEIMKKFPLPTERKNPIGEGGQDS